MPFILFSIKHTEQEDGLKSTQLEVESFLLARLTHSFILPPLFINSDSVPTLHNVGFNVFLSGFIVISFNGVFIVKTFDISSKIIIMKSRLHSSFEF